MPVYAKCPHCATHCNARDSQEGKIVPCPNCGSDIIVAPGDQRASALLTRREEAPRPAPFTLEPDGYGVRFRAEKEIARGGMGVILRAVDKEIGRDVVLKVALHSETEALRARFVEEAQVTGQLEHPNIVPVHETGSDAAGRPFFAMKMVRGRSLHEILDDLRRGSRASHRRYAILWRCQTFLKICEAMEFAHAKSVVHRDLKPENIMIGDYGEVLVMDWGLAKVGAAKPPVSAEEIDPVADTAELQAVRRTPENDSRTAGRRSRISTRSPSARQTESPISSRRAQHGIDRTLDGSVAGTPFFMSPEQARGEISEIDHRSDIYALGAILYEMLALRPPVDGAETDEILANAAEGRVVPIEIFDGRQSGRMRVKREVPKDLAAIAMKALAFSKDDRYQSVTQMREDVDAYLDGRSISAREETSWEALRKIVLRNKAASLIGVTAAVLLLGIGSVSLYITHSALQEAQQALREKKEKETLLGAAESGMEEAKQKAALAFVETARQSVRHRNFLAALHDIETACTESPSSPEAQMLRTQLLVFVRRYEDALQALDAYQALAPNDTNGELLRVNIERAIRGDNPAYAEQRFIDIFQRQKEFVLAETFSHSGEEVIVSPQGVIPAEQFFQNLPVPASGP